MHSIWSFEWVKPDLSHPRMFGSRVCVQQMGTQRAKLDKHDFTSIFLGYTATNQNVVYIDVNSSRVKSTHHAFFNKAWYMQESCSPRAQLLFDYGVVTQEDLTTLSTHVTHQSTLPESQKWLTFNVQFKLLYHFV